jgi:hypothetical protein
LVVGREDTGALEAQIRGSRYAWDIRLISVERLLKLLQVSERSEDSSTLNQIRQLLRPFEYTKIDGIIDVLFEAAADVETQQEIEQAGPEDARAVRRIAEHGTGETKSDDVLERGQTISSLLRGVEALRFNACFAPVLVCVSSEMVRVPA